MVKQLNLKIQFIRIQKLLVFLSIFLVILMCGTSIQAKTDTKSQTYKNLMGVGINSMREWTTCISGSAVGRVEEYSQVLSDGWRHLSFVICAKDYFPNDLLDERLLRIKLEAIRTQIRELKKQFPDRTFTITFKGYQYAGGWNEGGSGTILYQRIIKSKKMEAQYVKWWKLAAEIFKNEKSVAFWLMNEPDYRYKGGLKDYIRLVETAVDQIRKVSPKRWIIVNGTHGSVVGREKSASQLMQPINRDNIIYGFHYYGDRKMKWDDRDWLRKNVVSNATGWDNHLTKSLNEITSFKKRFQVPVMLSEINLVGTSKYVYGGVTIKERARIFGEIIVPWAKSCKCGLTWWALGDDTSPYIRRQDKSLGVVEYDRPADMYSRRPPKNEPLIRDELLFKALGLNDYFIFKKSKVKELQSILNDDGINVGDIDGVLGKKTIKGMEAWYEKRKIQFNKKTSDRLEYLIALQYIQNTMNPGVTNSNIKDFSTKDFSISLDLNKIIIDAGDPNNNE